MISDTIIKNIGLCFKVYGISFLSLLILVSCSYYFYGEVSIRKASGHKNLLISASFALIIAPLLEEFIFRYILNNFFDKKSLLIVAVSGLLYIYYRKPHVDARQIGLLLWLIFLWSSYFINLKYELHSVQNFKWLVYILSALIFSIGHIETFDTSKGNLMILFPLILMVSDGLLLTYVRLEAGIVWSIFTHFLMNLIPGSLLLYKYFNTSI